MKGGDGLSSIEIRPYTIDDFDDLLLIQQEAFPPPFPEELWWSRAHIEAHTATFPEGGMIAFYKGEPAGSATSLITTLHEGSHTWDEVADDGYIRATHDPHGDTLYGIDVCVRPDYRGRGVASALYEKRKQLVQKLGLARYAAGCRIPGYHEWADRLRPEQYMQEVAAGRIHDLVLSFMLRQGLTAVQPLADYVEDDESRNYAVLVEWRNPDYSS